MTSTSDSQTAADQVVAQLRRAGVDVIFGLPGEENLALVTAIRDAELPVVVCRHEQHAAFMAVAHARLTGNVGVCLSTLGPGALNLYTGLAQAQLLSVPVLAITGQKAARNNEEGSFQVVDVVGSAAPIVEHAESVVDPAVAAAATADCIARAEQRPGAVLLELPEDVAAADAGLGTIAVSERPLPQAADTTIDALVAEVERAERPLVLAGSACTATDVSEALRRLSSHTGLSVVATQMGKGSVDELNPRSVRSLGMHRPDYVHAAIDRADLILAIGYQPVEHPPLAWHRDDDQPVVHIHRRPASVEPGYRPTLEVVGDIVATLDQFGDRCPQVATDWSDQLHDAINRCLARELDGLDTPDGRLSVAAIVGTVHDACSDAVVALDNGLYKLWFARHYASRGPQSLLLDNALATMGAGLATGMEAARLGHRAVVVTGDGGLMMNVAELETAQRLGLDLTVLVLRDDAYGFIAWHQDEQDRDRHAVDIGNPNLATLAGAFGAEAVEVATLDELAAALDASSKAPGLRVIDCPVDYACNALLEREGLDRQVLERIGA